MNGEVVLQRIITEIFSPIYQFMVGMAFLYFFYGVFRFITDMNDPDRKNEGKRHMLYGTIGLFIILSVGGILKVFNSFFDTFMF